MLKEALGIDYFYFFMERHTPTYDKYGDIQREGRYHIHLITSGIKDGSINNANRRCRRLLYEQGSIGVPIKHMDFLDIDDMKIDLFNACCRGARWVNRYKYAIKTQVLQKPSYLESTVFYCLKDFKDKSDTDFMDLVVFNSSDYKKGVNS